jgi:hypothetical protein
MRPTADQSAAAQSGDKSPHSTASLLEPAGQLVFELDAALDVEGGP